MRAFASLFVMALACSAQETPEKLIDAGHWKRARSLVQQRLRDAPDDANALYLSSQIRAAFGDRTSPVDLAEKAVRLDGSTARYHRELLGSRPPDWPRGPSSLPGPRRPMPTVRKLLRARYPD